MRLTESLIPEVINLGTPHAPTSVLTAARDADGTLRPLDLPFPPTAAGMVATLDPDGHLILLGEATTLADLATLGRHLAWAAEHLFLLAHAARPLLVRTDAAPTLRVFVDAGQSTLTSVLGESTTLIPYRRVRWGNRLGMLVEAA